MRKMLCGAIFLSLAISGIFAQTQTPKAAKTLTNDNLESFKQARLKAETDYRAERARRGLPPLEEIEREQEIAAQKQRELSAKYEAEQATAQNAYLMQANVLRAESVSLDAEIEYVRALLREIPRPQVYYAINYLPFYNAYPNYFPAPILYGNGTQIGVSGGRINMNSGANVRVGATTVQPRQTGANIVFSNQPNAPFHRNQTPFANGTLVVPFTFPSYDALTRQELLSNLRALEQSRAGLAARWQLLADEAWRNGVRID